MQSLLACIRFLTILPLKSDFQGKSHELNKWFAVTGLLLGVILAEIDSLLCRFGASLAVISFIEIVAMIILTRGLHLDGLADTADALLSAKDREGKLAIMKDPHIGTMGMIMIFVTIGGKFIFLATIPAAGRITALLFMPVFGRFAMVLLMNLFPSARPDGLGSSFIQSRHLPTLLINTLVLIALGIALSARSTIILAILTLMVTAAFGRYCVSQLGGITGDTVGCLNEIIESLVLLAFAFI